MAMKIGQALKIVTKVLEKNKPSPPTILDIRFKGKKRKKSDPKALPNQPCLRIRLSKKKLKKKIKVEEVITTESTHEHGTPNRPLVLGS